MNSERVASVGCSTAIMSRPDYTVVLRGLGGQEESKEKSRHE